MGRFAVRCGGFFTCVKSPVLSGGTLMTKNEDIATAANTLLSTLATTFGRVSANMRSTSSKLADACERIRIARTHRQTA